MNLYNRVKTSFFILKFFRLIRQINKNHIWVKFLSLLKAILLKNFNNKLKNTMKRSLYSMYGLGKPFLKITWYHSQNLTTLSSF